MGSLLMNLLIIHIIITIFCVIVIKFAEVKIKNMMADIRFVNIISKILQTYMNNQNPYSILWIIVPVVNILFLIVYAIFSLAKDETIIKLLESFIEEQEKCNGSS